MIVALKEVQRFFQDFHILEKFWILSKTKKEVWRFPIYLLPPHMHILHYQLSSNIMLHVL